MQFKASASSHEDRGSHFGVQGDGCISYLYNASALGGHGRGQLKASARHEAHGYQTLDDGILAGGQTDDGAALPDVHVHQGHGGGAVVSASSPAIIACPFAPSGAQDADAVA